MQSYTGNFKSFRKLFMRITYVNYASQAYVFERKLGIARKHLRQYGKGAETKRKE